MNEPMWYDVVDWCWAIMWKTMAAFSVSAAIPAGVFAGLRVLKVVLPKVAQ